MFFTAILLGTGEPEGHWVSSILNQKVKDNHWYDNSVIFF